MYMKYINIYKNVNYVLIIMPCLYSKYSKEDIRMELI